MTTTIANLIEARFGLPATAGHDTPAEGTLAALLTRRVHRAYKPDPIPEDLMQTVLAAALSAPSKSDLQQVAILRVRDKAVHARIAGLIPSMPWIATAPAFFVFCGDNRRIRRIAELRGKPYPNDNLDQFMNAAVDAGIVLATFVIAAQAAGLGCCPISVIRDHVAEVSQLLELPPSVFPVAGLCVGFPASDGKLSMRLPMALTVHSDRYDDSRLEEEVAAYDKRRTAREPIAREKQRYAGEFGLIDAYGWSEDKARHYSHPERADFGEFIRGHGFKLA